jgi:toxin ParE1/3/4
VLELRLTPLAEADLEDIWHYTAQEWSEAQAERYIDTLLRSFDTLCAMPHIARLRTEFTPPLRIHPSGSHLIIYQEEKTALHVFRILGGKQNWQAILQTLDG